MIVQEFGAQPPKHDWRTITWLEGSGRYAVHSRFARGVCITCRRQARRRAEWRRRCYRDAPGEACATKYWLSTLD